MTGQEGACRGEELERKWEVLALRPVPSVVPFQRAKGSTRTEGEGQELWGDTMSTSSPPCVTLRLVGLPWGSTAREDTRP